MLSATQERAGSKSHNQNLKHHLWQPGFYDLNTYSEKTLLDKLDYIHNKPVKAGLFTSPGDYPWSSYRFYLSEERTLAERQLTAGRHVQNL